MPGPIWSFTTRPRTVVRGDAYVLAENAPPTRVVTLNWPVAPARTLIAPPVDSAELVVEHPAGQFGPGIESDPELGEPAGLVAANAREYLLERLTFGLFTLNLDDHALAHDQRQRSSQPA